MHAHIGLDIVCMCVISYMLCLNKYSKTVNSYIDLRSNRMITECPIPSEISNICTALVILMTVHGIGCVFYKSRLIQISQTRSIKSSEKERTDLSGCSGRGHLVLVCAERHRPRPLLEVNKQRQHPVAQMDVAESDFSQMHWNRSGFD